MRASECVSRFVKKKKNEKENIHLPRRGSERKWFMRTCDGERERIKVRE